MEVYMKQRYRIESLRGGDYVENSILQLRTCSIKQGYCALSVVVLMEIGGITFKVTYIVCEPSASLFSAL